jgi:hypothetical protein
MTDTPLKSSVAQSGTSNRFSRWLNVSGWLSDPRPWLWIASITILAPLMVYAYLGLFARFQADDYCLAWNSQRPFLSAQTSWYTTDSSRYGATLVFTLSDKLGRWTVPMLPAFVITLWLLGTFWLLHRFQKMLKLSIPPIASFLIAELWLYFILMLAPNLYQILYWRAGMVTYLLPLVGLTYLAVFLLSQAANPIRKWRLLMMVLAVLFFYLNGGFSETMAAIQIGMLALTLVACLHQFVPPKGSPRDKWVITLLGCALLGSLLAMATLYFSPATRMRQGLIGIVAPNLFNLVRMSLKNAFLFMYISLDDMAFPFVILMLSGLLVAYAIYSVREPNSKIKPSLLISLLFLLPVIAYLWIVCVSAPIAFGEATYPEGRVQLDALYIMMAMVLGEGLLLGLCLGLLQQRSGEMVPVGLRVVTLLLLVALSFFPLYSTRKVLTDLPAYQQRAQFWDLRDAQIRSQAGQGQEDITVTAYTSVAGLMEMGPDSSMWVNGCAALYYGVHSITAELP